MEIKKRLRDLTIKMLRGFDKIEEVEEQQLEPQPQPQEQDH